MRFCGGCGGCCGGYRGGYFGGGSYGISRGSSYGRGCGMGCFVFGYVWVVIFIWCGNLLWGSCFWYGDVMYSYYVWRGLLGWWGLEVVYVECCGFVFLFVVLEEKVVVECDDCGVFLLKIWFLDGVIIMFFILFCVWLN